MPPAHTVRRTAPAAQAALSAAGLRQLASGGDGWGAPDVLQSLLTIAGPEQSPQPAGGHAPGFKLASTGGGTVSLADLAGKPLVINFWRGDCPPCRAEMPLLQQRVGPQSKVQLVLINWGESTEAARSFLSRVGINQGSLLDSDLAVALAWVVFRQRRPLVAWLATASLVAIAAEGALGGVVVANELASWWVLVHLGLAMIILGFLIATAVMSLPASTGASEPSFRRLAAVAAALTYGLLLTGSTVVASSADEGCRAWPLCASGFAFDFAGANAFTMLHRGAVLVIGAVLVYTLIQALRHPATKAAASATLVVLGLQVAVGAGAAVTGAALFNGLHVAMATLVWAGMLSIALVTLPRADRRPALSRLAVDKRPA